MVYSIKISDQTNGVLKPSLNDILSQIDGGKLQWSIQLLEAVGKHDQDISVLELEDTVNNSKNGLHLTWGELTKLASQLEYIIDLLLIADSDETNLQRHSSLDGTYNSCDITIELKDSSYWQIHAKSNATIDRLEKQFTETERA